MNENHDINEALINQPHLEDDVNSLPVGTLLDNGLKDDKQVVYKIEKLLGDGGFGLVYKAKARVQGKNGKAQAWCYFAIKEFFLKGCKRTPEHSLVDKSERSFINAKKNFKHEAEQLRKFNIPNIVRVNECFEANNTIYYVMQFIEGDNLYEYVSKNGAFNEKDALNVLTPVIEAVGKLHNEKRLHLDIKPNNIMLGEDGGKEDKYVELGAQKVAPILIDFGSLERANYQDKIKLTYRTEGYSSPEHSYPDVFGFEDKFDERLDVFSLGATMYYLLVGDSPRDTPRTVDEYAPYINSIKENLTIKGVSEGVKDAVAHAMHPNRKLRTSSALAFLQDLGKAVALEKELEEERRKKIRNRLLLLGVTIFIGITSFFIWNIIDENTKTIKRLQTAIEQHDKMLLTEFAMVDSLRAIKHLVAEHEMDSNFIMAWYWAERVKAIKDRIPGNKADIDAIIARTEMFRQNAIAKVDTSSNDFKKLTYLLGINSKDLLLSFEQPTSTQSATPAQPLNTANVAETAHTETPSTTLPVQEEKKEITSEPEKVVEVAKSKSVKKLTIRQLVKVVDADPGNKEALKELGKRINAAIEAGNSPNLDELLKCKSLTDEQKNAINEVKNKL
ncbi:MAG: serine/threonine protein kinase [Muribaculaceae bacterium]|nr:serine/threonine protein kinase [Muribaculaceae bacterium]